MIKSLRINKFKKVSFGLRYSSLFLNLLDRHPFELFRYYIHRVYTFRNSRKYKWFNLEPSYFFVFSKIVSIMTNILKNTTLFKWIIILFRKSIELISRAIHFFIRLIVYFTKYERFFFTMGQCLFRHRTKTRFFFFFFFFLFCSEYSLKSQTMERRKEKTDFPFKRSLFFTFITRIVASARISGFFFFNVTNRVEEDVAINRPV